MIDLLWFVSLVSLIISIGALLVVWIYVCIYFVKEIKYNMRGNDNS